MKKLLVGAAALATAFVLAACSGGNAQAPSGNAAAAAGTGGGVPSTTSAAPTTTVTVPTTTETTTTKPAPTTTSKPKPKPAPKPQPKPADPGVPCANAAAASGTSACVDLSAHKAWLLQDGKVIYSAGALGGRKDFPTPIGTFHVYSKEKIHLSKEFDNAPMRNSVFFYPGDAFHTGSLSVPSHGCVHLGAGASQKFFDTLSVGDLVQVVA